MQTLIIVLTVVAVIFAVLTFIGEMKDWGIALLVCCSVGFLVSFMGMAMAVAYMNDIGYILGLSCGVLNVLSVSVTGVCMIS